MLSQDPKDNDLWYAKNRSASGGVNTFSSPLDIGDDQVVDLTNGLASVPGIRKVRPGSSVVASGITYGPVLAMSEFTPSTFVPELLVVTPGATFPNAANLKLWKWDGTGGQFTLVGTLSGFTSATLPVEIITGLDLNAGGGPAVARITSQQALDYDWYYAGGALTACTGANARPSTGMFPMGTAVGRAFAAGRAGVNRGKAYYSDSASWTWTGWSSNQAFTMGGGTRQEIVAIKDFRQADIIFFLKDRIEALHLDGDPIAGLSGTLSTAGLWSRAVIDRSIGCGSRRTVQTVGEDLFFLDQYGNVRSLAQTITDTNQGTKRLPVSAKIQSWIDRINPSAIETAQGAAFDRYYIIALPIDDAVTPSHTFVYDTINDSWNAPWTGGPWSKAMSIAVATLGSATTASDRNPTVYIGGAETLSGKVYRAFVGTGDDGSPIVYQEITKRESFATLDAKKIPRRVRVYALPAAGATMMIEARKDGADWKVVGYADLSGGSPQLPLTGPIDLTGSGIVEKVYTLEQSFQNARDLQYRFTVTAGVDVQILGHTSMVHMKEVDWQVTLT